MEFTTFLSGDYKHNDSQFVKYSPGTSFRYFGGKSVFLYKMVRGFNYNGEAIWVAIIMNKKTKLAAA